jgi:hypothetical protein
MSDEAPIKLKPTLRVLLDESQLSEMVTENFENQGYKVCDLKLKWDQDSGNFDIVAKLCGNGHRCECAIAEEMQKQMIEAMPTPHIAKVVGADPSYAESDLFED